MSALTLEAGLEQDLKKIEAVLAHFWAVLEKDLQVVETKGDAAAILVTQEVKAFLGTEIGGDLFEYLEFRLTGKVEPETVALAKNAIDRVLMVELAVQAFPVVGTLQEKSDWIASVLKALGVNKADRVYALLATDVAQNVDNLQPSTTPPTFAAKLAALDAIYLQVKAALL